MRKLGSIPFAFPDFRGAARLLIVVNLVAICIIELTPSVFPSTGRLFSHLLFFPNTFLQGEIWQPFTYTLVHSGIAATLLELLSVWFLASFLESNHGQNWVVGLYVVSAVGAALAATAIYIACGVLGYLIDVPPLYGCMGAIFGMLMVIGVLYGDIQFMMFFLIGIKARYMAIIYALVAIAMLFTSQKLYAFSQLGGALAAFVYIRLLPRRGVNFRVTEGWYALRNRYYRWKRRKASRKFEVYMRKQGRTVRFDGQGRPIDPDRTGQDRDDKKRWN